MALPRPSSLQTGATLWTASIQYYAVQLLVSAGWSANHRYSWLHNTISDLGNTHCGSYGARLVCSPEHSVMNLSFVALGVTMASGALVLRARLARNLTSQLGFISMVISGFGTLLVGLFPENTVSALHVTGAILAFVVGNLGIGLLGVGLSKLPLWLRSLTIIFSLAGLIGLLLFAAHVYGNLGIGGIERIAGYPQSVWMIIFGFYLLSRRDNRADNY